MQKAINGTVFWLIYSFRGKAPSGAMLAAGEVKWDSEDFGRVVRI